MTDRQHELELLRGPAGKRLPATGEQFARLPLEVLLDARFLGLPKSSVLVFLYLLAYRNGVAGSAWPSMRRLARELHLQLGTVCSAVRRLGDSGLVTISVQLVGDPPRWGNVYDFDRSHCAERSPVQRSPNGDGRPLGFPSGDRSDSHASTVRIAPNKTEEGTERENKETPLPPFFENEQPREDDPITPSDRHVHRGDFSEFWQAIPKRHRQAPVACQDEFVRALRRGADSAVMTARIGEYYRSYQGRGEFANQPKSWLAGGKYDDPAVSWKSAELKAAKARNERLADYEPRPANIGDAAC